VTIAYIAMGSNMGDRLLLLAQAVQLLKTPTIRVLDVSSIYETAPQGFVDQPSFLNLVAKVQTDLSPQELLSHTQAIEAQLGRVRNVRWGPRTVDLDILLFGDRVVDEVGLQIPHPRMTQRAFVLVPLLELNSDLTLPMNVDHRLTSHLSSLPGQGVRQHMTATDFREAHLCLRDI